MSETAIYLYIFSGPHLGAKIALPLGKHILGSDDSADIQLCAQSTSDDFAIAPRHALLSIEKDDNGNLNINIESIDGAIYKDLERNTDESFTLNNGEIFYLSATCMVWNYPNVQQETIIPKITQQVISTSESIAQEQENENIVDTTPLENNIDSEVDNSVLTLEEQKAPPKKKSFLRKIILPTTLAVVLLSLSLYFEPQNDNIALEINYLTTKFAENKIDNIEIYQQTINGQNSILLEGFVKSESEHKKIQDLARTLHFPVYLALSVQEDTLIAIQNSFMLLGIYPFLEMENSALNVSAYIKDYLVEEAAFADVKSEVSNLPPLERKIIHKDELSVLIDAKFIEKDIKKYLASYLDGSIHISGDFNGTDIKTIHTAMNEVIDNIGIPINYSILPMQAAESVPLQKESNNIFESANTTSVATNTSQTQDKPINNDTITLAGLNITSVYSGAIPFITTQEGQRLFAGALLPNGFTIESINNGHIVLRKNSQVVTIDIEK